MEMPQAPDEQAGTVPMPLDKRFINTLPPSEMEQMVRKAVPRFLGNECRCPVTTATLSPG